MGGDCGWWCGGKREGFRRVEGGHAAVGSSSKFAMLEKEQFMASLHGEPFEEESLEAQEGKL